MKRQIEVTAEKFDYARLMTQNINIIPVKEFKHKEELFYFITNLRLRVSEDNIAKCLKGFLSLADTINDAELQSAKYLEFVDILQSQIPTISAEETKLLIL